MNVVSSVRFPAEPLSTVAYNRRGSQIVTRSMKAELERAIGCSMSELNPITRTMTVADVKDALASVIDAVHRKETRVLVQNSGISVAAIVAAEDLELLNRLDEQRTRRHDVVAAMREPFRGVSPDAIERETDRIIAEIRSEDRVHAASAR